MLYQKEVLTSHKVTIKDLARMTGVSTAAVSNALAGKSNISVAKRSQICELAEQMGYEPNTVARNFHKSLIRIAVGMPNTPPSIFEKFRRGFAQATAEYEGGKLELHLLTYSTISEDAEAVFEEMAGGGYDGLILSHPDIYEDRRLASIERIHARGIPVVSLGDRLTLTKTCGHVMLDGAVGGRIAADFFGAVLSPGERADVFAAVVPPQDMYKRYIDNFEQELGFYGLSLGQVHASCDYPEVAYEKALARFSSPDAPRAAFVSTYSAWMVCKALEELGKSREVRLVGVDAPRENCAYLRSGSLAAIIDQRQEEQARRAFRALLSCLDGGSAGLISINPYLITRGRLKDEE